MTPTVWSLMLLASPEGGSAGLSILLFQIGAIALVFYFLVIRPQGQARKRHAEMLSQLKRGDEVMTAGGVIGKVKDLKEDRITIESGSASLVVDRSRIVKVGDAMAPGQQ